MPVLPATAHGSRTPASRETISSRTRQWAAERVSCIVSANIVAGIPSAMLGYRIDQFHSDFAFEFETLSRVSSQAAVKKGAERRHIHLGTRTGGGAPAASAIRSTTSRKATGRSSATATKTRMGK